MLLLSFTPAPIGINGGIWNNCSIKYPQKQSQYFKPFTLMHRKSSFLIVHQLMAPTEHQLLGFQKCTSILEESSLGFAIPPSHMMICLYRLISVVKFRHSVLINPIQIQQKPDNPKVCEPSFRKEAFGSIIVKKDSDWINLI
jgi:hypothetical protein